MATRSLRLVPPPSQAPADAARTKRIAEARARSRNLRQRAVSVVEASRQLRERVEQRRATFRPC